ncbi:hypothetical protein RclHR1_24620002 [Rhizophagus clarus]|uniref:Reverse transcriptase domain-containing protein n=1 Tax=Rhizophagus clarus TaxID=94130 RepID=A0A2Z6QXU9_9GLOM|nr:hypothetical protein RclHR1_24620002 [Rhizophagus clarus]
MNRSNRVFTAHGDTLSYQVRIGIDQDPYILQAPTLLPITTDDTSNIAINNLVFMDDSTLISSSKARLEYMPSITEEFYALNNTSANHQKYVFIRAPIGFSNYQTVPISFGIRAVSVFTVYRTETFGKFTDRFQ